MTAKVTGPALAAHVNDEYQAAGDRLAATGVYRSVVDFIVTEMQANTDPEGLCYAVLNMAAAAAAQVLSQAKLNAGVTDDDIGDGMAKAPRHFFMDQIATARAKRRKAMS